MRKNGFTLVELIIAITIFGLIMLVSVPNITSMVDKNKRKAYVNDAKKLVKLARYKFYTTCKDVRPSSGCYKVYKITDLDRSNLDSPPNGGSYNNNYSYVTVIYSGNSYIFRVQLVEEYHPTGKSTEWRYRGVPYTESTNLDKTGTGSTGSTAKATYVSQTKTNLNSFTPLPTTNICAYNYLCP